jgi:predicted acylesterase/phospholipase RssA
MSPIDRKESRAAAAATSRLGLALSGGGFRASFFHIGLLAQMAMLGLLRHVEVISTVSGGSIIGALYYLHVKRLLESKPDAEIEDQDYKAIVERIECEFLTAVQRNIRMRTFLDPVKNLRMALANYSRSDRIGELYDVYFYRPVLDPQRTTPIEMRELKIRPRGEREGFHPLKHNASRGAKVPIVLINATSLNTGHNWRFEASRMGEPPREGQAATEIDKNLRLRRPPSYADIIAKQQNIELGLAVAASAGVPGIFNPLAISDLYPDGIRVQLVDGGVHDNQGIQGLLDVDCKRFIVSDAAGQMETERDPATGLLSVLPRSNTISMARVREEELSRLLDRSSNPVAFLHLRKGLAAQAVSWIGPDGRPAEQRKVERQPDAPPESFQVAQEVQELLSRIRTDLDSFTEVEAYSLMLDAYNMGRVELPRSQAIKELIPAAPQISAPRWRFLAVAPWMIHPNPRYEKQLRVGGLQAFKIFRLSPAVTGVTLAALLGLLLGLGLLCRESIGGFLSFSFSMGQLLLFVLLLLLFGLVPRLSRTFQFLDVLRAPSEFVVRLVLRATPSALASAFVWLHLAIFDRLFLRCGRISRLDPPPA